MKQAFIATIGTLVALSLGACSDKKESEYRSPDSASVSYQTPAGIQVVIRDENSGRMSLCTSGGEEISHDDAVGILKYEVLRITEMHDVKLGSTTIKYVTGQPVWAPYTLFRPDSAYEEECIFFGYGAGVGDAIVIYGEEKPSPYNGYIEWKP